MTTTTLIHLSPDELLSMMETVVERAIQKRFDRPVGAKEVAQLWGVSVQTVKKAEQKGEIKRINPQGMHPKYSMNEVMNHNKYKL